MSIPLNVKSIEEVPENARKFVSESDGAFSLDNDGLMKGLLAEREVSAGLRGELNAFKELKLTAEQIKDFAALGKTPAELAEIIATASKSKETKANVKMSTEYLELQKEVDALKGIAAKFEAAEAENLRNKRNNLVRKAVREMSDEFDKELFGAFVDETLLERFALNDEKNGLAPVDGKLPGDYLTELAGKFNFRKTSTAGDAKPGNAGMSSGSKANVDAALQKGDYLTALKALR
jgi:hypothetical protein